MKYKLQKIISNILLVLIITITTLLHASDDIENNPKRIKLTPIFSDDSTHEDVCADTTPCAQPDQSNNLNDNDYLSWLADEIKLNICQFLSVADVKQLGRVNTAWFPVTFDTLQIKCLQFAYAQHAHFDGHLSDFHYKFIAAVLEKRFELKISDKGSAWYPYYHIDDYGYIYKIERYFDRYRIDAKGLNCKCTSGNMNVIGGTYKNGETFGAALYDRTTKEIIPIVYIDDRTHSDITELNYDGSIGIGSYYSSKRFADSNRSEPCQAIVWSKDYGMKYLYACNENSSYYAKCLSDDGKIIGGMTTDKIDDSGACVWIDLNYYYNLKKLLTQCLPLEQNKLLQNSTLCSIYALSQNGTAMLGHGSNLDNPGIKYFSIVIKQ